MEKYKFVVLQDAGSNPVTSVFYSLTFSLGGIGRHVGLKIQFFFKSVGSSPTVLSINYFFSICIYIYIYKWKYIFY